MKLSKWMLPLEPPERFNAMLSRKNSKPLLSHMLNVVMVSVGKLTDGWVSLTVVVITRAHKILQKQGLAGLVKYLKVCSVLVQQVIGGHVEHDLTSLGPRVSRSKSGLPRLLPVSARRKILQGDDRFIRHALTLFALYRVISYIGTLKTKTITNGRLVGLQGEHSLYPYISKFVGLFIRGTDHIGSLSSVKPFPIYTASPNALTRLGQHSTHHHSVLRSFFGLIKTGQIKILMEYVDLLKVDHSFTKILAKL